MARRPAFTISYAPETYKHLDWIEFKYHRLVATTIEEQLSHTPATAAVLLAPKDNDDLERLMLAHSRRFQSLLSKSRRSIEAGKGVSHDEFWKIVPRRHRAKRPSRVRKRRLGS